VSALLLPEGGCVQRSLEPLTLWTGDINGASAGQLSALGRVQLSWNRSSYLTWHADLDSIDADDYLRMELRAVRPTR